MVKLKGVKKTYGEITALDDTSLDVRRGEFLTLLGPSGSGKTTLLNIISGMTPPTAGRVWIDGRDVTDVPPSQRGLGMVFQNYALMPHMTVFENIAFPLRVRKLPRHVIVEKVRNMLALVGLEHVSNRRPRELSGGQQQRIALARCIVYDPRLILMDEPLGALDKKLREQMQVEIKRLHTQFNITMVYVTHDQEEALTMSDRIMLMNNGRAIQVGTPYELYFHPATLFAAGFVGESNLIDGEVIANGSRRLVRLLSGDVIKVEQDLQEAVGRRGKLLIRPETLSFGPVARESENRVRGKIYRSAIVGSLIKHYVSVNDRITLIVQELSNARTRIPESGTDVVVTWTAEHGRMLFE